MKKPAKTTKKKAQKEEVQKMDLHQAFNLNDVSEETLEGYVFYLKEMVNSAGWRLMVQIMEGNLALLERQIVKKKAVISGNKLTEQEVDSLRDQHEIMEEMIQKPHELIAKYGKQRETEPTPDYNPYGGDKKTVNAETMSDST